MDGQKGFEGLLPEESVGSAPEVLKTEEQLMQAIPKDKWSRAHHWLIFHGRQVCAARKPACEACTLRAWCDYANGEKETAQNG